MNSGDTLISGPYLLDPSRHDMSDFYSGQSLIDRHLRTRTRAGNLKSKKTQLVYTISGVPGEREQVAAYVSATLRKDDQGACLLYIHYVATDTRYQRQGFATALLRAALEHLSKSLPTKIEAIILSADTPLISFYEKRGFTFVRGEMKLALTEDQLSLVANWQPHPHPGLTFPVAALRPFILKRSRVSLQGLKRV